MKTIAELAQVTDPLRKRIEGAIRRMTVALSNGGIWQGAGTRQLDGTTETVRAEVFGTAGVFGRPAAGRGEVIVAMLHADAKTPVIVAVRDEATRAAIMKALELAEDETALYNSQAVVHVKADGTVEVRAPNGAAVPLALKSDVQAVKSTFDSHVHVSAAPASPTSAPATHPSPPTIPGPFGSAAIPEPVGTSVLRGE